jgi:hypothetical protein
VPDNVEWLMGEFELLLSFTEYNDVVAMASHQKQAAFFCVGLPPSSTPREAGALAPFGAVSFFIVRVAPLTRKRRRWRQTLRTISCFRGAMAWVAHP